MQSYVVWCHRSHIPLYPLAFCLNIKNEALERPLAELQKAEREDQEILRDCRTCPAWKREDMPEHACTVKTSKFSPRKYSFAKS
jgi:hypothetical protein